MCSLCGVLGGRGHWTDSGTNPDAFQDRAVPRTRLQERQQRVRLTNVVLSHYGLELADWAATAYVLQDRTGHRVIVQNLTEVWAAAEGLLKGPCDPLDDALLARMARHHP